METDIYDLRALAKKIVERVPTIESLRLFGSRRYRTRSKRSDVDLLVSTSAYVAPGDLRALAGEICPALDFFLVNGGRAVSCANESFVEAASFEELVARLEAIEFWNHRSGVLEASGIDWKVEIQRGVSFPPTMMRGDPFAAWLPAVQELFSNLEREGLPTKPFVGSTINDWADYLPKLIERIVLIASKPRFRGKGISILLNDEYDFQDVFHLVAKPWLPGLVREPHIINFDGQKKNADFAIGNSRIVIEMKYIKDAGSKAGVVKTLSGLKEFYRLNANVRLLVFAILSAPDLEFDGPKWEHEFSSNFQGVIVRTVVVKL